MGEDLRKMADWLRSGATLLTESCPQCGSPLFQVNEEIWCLKCDKRVIRAQEAEAPTIIERSLLLEEMEKTIQNKLRDLREKLSSEQDPVKMQQIGESMLLFLDLLNKTRAQLKPHK